MSKEKSFITFGPGLEVIKIMPNSTEHEMLNAYKYENSKKFGFFSGSDKLRMLFFLLINIKMKTIVGILTFMSRKNFFLSCVEEDVLITSG